MPFAIPVILQTLWGLRYLILSIALVGAFWWWSAHERDIGEAKIKAAVQQATQAEHERRESVLAYYQQWAQGAIQNVDQINAKNAKLRVEVTRLAAANRSKPCLDEPSARSVLGIGR